MRLRQDLGALLALSAPSEKHLPRRQESHAEHAQGHVPGRLAREAYGRQKKLFLDDRQRLRIVQSMLRKKIK